MFYKLFLNTIRFAWRVVSDALFPIICRQCGGEGHWLCQVTPAAWTYCCWSCRKALVHGAVCDCGHAQQITGCWWLVDYHREPVVTRLWHDVKYAHCWQALPTLQSLVPTIRPSLKPAVIVPVPLHVWRYRQRGFNQAASIAHWLAAAGWGTVMPIIERVRATPAQQQLNRSQRLQNVQAAFWSPSVSVVGLGPHIILVDDVWTTGATLHACALALRHAGYTGRIDAAVLFRD